jgi:hypothetical protein
VWQLFRGWPRSEGFEVRQRPARDVMYDSQNIIGTQCAPSKGIRCLAGDGAPEVLVHSGASGRLPDLWPEVLNDEADRA